MIIFWLLWKYTKELQTLTRASKLISFCTSESISLKITNSSSKEPSFSSSQKYSVDAIARQMDMKSQSPEKLILGHLNIDSI